MGIASSTQQATTGSSHCFDGLWGLADALWNAPWDGAHAGHDPARSHAGHDGHASGHDGCPDDVRPPGPACHAGHPHGLPAARCIPLQCWPCPLQTDSAASRPHVWLPSNMLPHTTGVKGVAVQGIPTSAAGCLASPAYMRLASMLHVSLHSNGCSAAAVLSGAVAQPLRVFPPHELYVARQAAPDARPRAQTRSSGLAAGRASKGSVAGSCGSAGGQGSRRTHPDRPVWAQASRGSSCTRPQPSRSSR